MANSLGNYSEIYNLPGFINFDKNSSTYLGPLELKERADEINRETPSQIMARFMKGGRVNTQKIKALLQNLNQTETQAKLTFCQKDLVPDGLDNDWCLSSSVTATIDKKWKKEYVARAYTYARYYLKQAIELSPAITTQNINDKEAREFLNAFFEGLEAFEVIKGEDEVLGTASGPKAIALKAYRFILGKSKISNSRPHASNLLKQDGIGANDNRLFYSEKELTALKNKGLDLSTLNPPDNGLWRKPQKPIRDFDTSNYDGLDLPGLERVLNKSEIEDLLNPEKEIVMEMTNKLPEGGESPKLDARYKDVKFKVKFLTHKHADRTDSPFYEGARFFQGSEVNVETAVNNIAAALGFSVEPTYYKRSIRLYFPEKVYQKGQFDQRLKKLIEAVTLRFEPSWNAKSALENIKKDANGRPYIHMRGVQLEIRKNSKLDGSIGFFPRAGLGKSLKREHRAFALFLAWIMDVDPKDENNKVKLVPSDKAPGYKLIFSNSDMGASLGVGYPNLYNFKLIKKIIRNSQGQPVEIELNYRRIYGLKTLSAINMDDAKWLVRLMAQLTYEQYKKAFIASGITHMVAEFYAQIMINKRNELVRALNLAGQSFIDVDGQERSYSLLPGFTGEVKGGERYFRDGLLIDPLNELYDSRLEPFPRYWGTDFRNFKGGPKSIWEYAAAKALELSINGAHSLFLDDIAYSNQGLIFSPLNSNSLAPECSGSDCFVQGLQFGVNGFAPMRFFTINPNKDPKYKYWAVDVFRVGFYVGSDGRGIIPGIGTEGPLGLSFGAKFYKMSEYIKVKPLKNGQELLKNLQSLAKITTFPLKSARVKFVNGMKEGEILVHSTYLGLKSSLVARPLDALSPLPFGPSIRLTGDALTASRVTLLKESPTSVMANWGRLKQSTLQARLNLIDFFIQIPLLDITFRKLQTVENTFRFNWSKTQDKKFLLSNLSSTYPQNIPAMYRFERRQAEVATRRSSFDLLGLRQSKNYRSKIEVNYTNFKDHIKATDLAYKTRKYIKRPHGLDFEIIDNRIKASINDKDGMYAKINIYHKVPTASREDFVSTYEWYKPVLPENFILFDPKAVKSYLGDLIFNMETIFSPKALAHIFDKRWSAHGLCINYGRLHHFESPEDECSKLSKRPEPIDKSNGKIEVQSSDVDDFKDVYEEYQEARVKYWKLMSLNKKDKHYKKVAYKALKEIVDMLKDTKYYEYRLLKFFIMITPKDLFYRRAQMTSSLEAFPGHEEEINESDWARGTYYPQMRMLSKDPTMAFELFSDKIHRGLNTYMLNYVREL